MLSLLNMTAGAQRMAQTDPHGLTLSLIAIFTVFTALLILYIIYSCIGKVANADASVMRLRRRRRSGNTPDEETAAAITMALEAELGAETDAAIAMALYLYLNDQVHDAEPGIITFAPRTGEWGQPVNNFRKNPVR